MGPAGAVGQMAEEESKTALLSLFRRVLKDAAPVHVIDTRAQADALSRTPRTTTVGSLHFGPRRLCRHRGLRLAKAASSA